MKVVINRTYGGFGLSKEFIEAYPQFKEYDYSIYDDTDQRSDKDFISALESFGLEKAKGRYAILKIVEMPNDVTDWEIAEYDGSESITCVVDGKIKHLY